MFRAIAVLCAVFVVGSTLLVGQVAPPKNAKGKPKAASEKKQKSKAERPAAESKKTPTTEPVDSNGGVVVVVDPATRQIRPATPAEIGALTAAAAAAQPTPGPPVVISGPGGATGVVLGDNSQTYTVATRSPDGGVRVVEVTADKATADKGTEGRVVPDEKRKSSDEK